MRLAQTAPGVPDPSTLKDLPTPVAILLLVVILVLAVLFYFGPALRDRIPKKPPETGTPGQQATGATPVAGTAVDRAAMVEDRYTAYLREQIQKLEVRVADLERENQRLRADVDTYRMQQLAVYNQQPRRRDE